MSAGRKYFTDRERREAFERQGGKCIVPGCESTGPFEDEHEIPNYFLPGKPSGLMCVPHHKEKTRRDRKAIARTKRLNGESTSQFSRREKRKAEGKPPSLRGPGFRKPKTADEILGTKR